MQKELIKCNLLIIAQNYLFAKWGLFKTNKGKEEDVLAKLPENPLEVWLEVNEHALRKLPAYGPDFKIDRDKLQYKGDPDNLIIAFENDLVDNMIVEAYPVAVDQKKMRTHEHQWLHSQILAAHRWVETGFHKMPIEGKKMYQVLGSGKIEFGCTFKNGNKLRNYDLSLDEQLPQIGGRYLDYFGFIHHLNTPVGKVGNYIVVAFQGKKYRISVSYDNGKMSVVLQDPEKNPKVELEEDSFFVI